MKLSGPGLLFAGRFFITVSISVLVMGLPEGLASPNRAVDYKKMLFAAGLNI